MFNQILPNQNPYPLPFPHLLPGNSVSSSLSYGTPPAVPSPTGTLQRPGNGNHQVVVVILRSPVRANSGEVSSNSNSISPRPLTDGAAGFTQIDRQSPEALALSLPRNAGSTSPKSLALRLCRNKECVHLVPAGQRKHPTRSKNLGPYCSAACFDRWHNLRKTKACAKLNHGKNVLRRELEELLQAKENGKRELKEAQSGGLGSEVCEDLQLRVERDQRRVQEILQAWSALNDRILCERKSKATTNRPNPNDYI
jgi:hypothetical protein